MRRSLAAWRDTAGAIFGIDTMSLEADLVVDRQRLKRRLLVWRVVAVLALVLAVWVGTRQTGRIGVAGFTRHIERYRIGGVIGDGRDTIEDLRKLGEDSSVAAVLLHLDTPGGQVAGGEGIHDAVQKLARKKPVVAVMDGLAASAGYMIAVATPHIVARESTITGSIGVIMETASFGGLLEKVGVSVDPLVSGPMKGQPSLDKPMTPQARQVLQDLVGDLFEQFVDLVAAGRHMDPAKVRALADGRAYTGRQAKALGLVDEIGGDDQARQWLEKTAAVPAGLEITEPDRRPWAQRLGAGSLADIVTTAQQALRVDGAWSVWQPSLPR
jgi:protease-4